MGAIKEGVLYGLFLSGAFLFAFGVWAYSQQFIYKHFYENMVIQTINEIVKSECRTNYIKIEGEPVLFDIKSDKIEIGKPYEVKK